jgi:hypothetical protein
MVLHLWATTSPAFSRALCVRNAAEQRHGSPPRHHRPRSRAARPASPLEPRDLAPKRKKRGFYGVLVPLGLAVPVAPSGERAEPALLSDGSAALGS